MASSSPRRAQSAPASPASVSPSPALPFPAASDVCAPEASACSPRRLAANRANANKSTGPRTRAGKERSRLNALVHGLTASLSILPGEKVETFRRLADGIYAELRPRGQAEVVLVDQYVSIAWKLRRLGSAERSVGALHYLKDMCEWAHYKDDRAWALRNPAQFTAEDLKMIADDPAGPPPEPVAAPELLAEELKEGNGPLLRLMELEMRLRATLSSTLKQLKDLRALRKAQREAEREEAEEDGAAPWEPGEWDRDAGRLREVPTEGDEEGGAETEQEQPGEEDTGEQPANETPEWEATAKDTAEAPVANTQAATPAPATLEVREASEAQNKPTARETLPVREDLAQVEPRPEDPRDGEAEGGTVAEVPGAPGAPTKIMGNA